MRYLLAVHDGITLLAFRVACVALVVLLGSYLVEMVARYGFNSPTRWTSDLVQYMLCVSMSLALPLVTRDGGHVAITSFLEKATARQQAVAARWIQALGALTLAAFAVIFAIVSSDQARQGIETVAAFAIPKWWLSAVVVIGLSCACLHLFRQALGLDAAQAGHEMDV
jgi:TRAP-type C4-dicarboxylate transport system permease small subunit